MNETFALISKTKFQSVMRSGNLGSFPSSLEKERAAIREGNRERPSASVLFKVCGTSPRGKKSTSQFLHRIQFGEVRSLRKTCACDLLLPTQFSFCVDFFQF